MASEKWLDGVRFGPDGLVPVVVQDALSGTVLMLAYANREALERTRSTRQGHYFSRSRAQLWRKGEASGHTQEVAEVRVDCDGDTVLYRVVQTGPACHTGNRTCFSGLIGEGGEQTESPDPGGHLLDRLGALIADRARERPEGSYTVRLLDSGVGRIAQKVGEEGVEVVVAATNEDAERLASEAADLLFHLLVLLEARGVPLDRLWRELEKRKK